VVLEVWDPNGIPLQDNPNITLAERRNPLGEIVGEEMGVRPS